MILSMKDWLVFRNRAESDTRLCGAERNLSFMKSFGGRKRQTEDEKMS